MKILINAGANLSVRDSAWNRTPLEWAEYGDRKEIIEYLKEIEKSKRN